MRNEEHVFVVRVRQQCFCGGGVVVSKGMDFTTVRVGARMMVGYE